MSIFRINRAISRLILAFSLSLLTQISAQTLDANDSLPVVPKPHSIRLTAGNCKLPQEISVSVPEDKLWREHIDLVGKLMARQSDGNRKFKFANTGQEFLTIKKIPTANSNQSPENYRLKIRPDHIQLEAASLKGLCHATATLIQLVLSKPDAVLPLAEISDSPKLNYRSFMIDMGRNPHSAALLRETIDLLWFYKVDSLHLHLTDDQRFAFPSTRFPKLWDGIISLKEFRDIEAYAKLRGVTLIPELEVPGHSGIMRTRYPETFGKSPTELASQKDAYEGITTLLDELMDVFSSPYIHIGGDEAFGVAEELQRDLINKLDSYLKSKGRQTIVWEGPRPGTGKNKVNTDVIHLNWRMINYSPDQMLNDGYRVVNAAWDPLYIVDHYPRINFTMTSPEYIYENLKPTRFRHVNPGIRTFAKPVEVKPTDRLLGFCMPWWEGREVNFFAQIVPRLLPFADVAWNPDQQRDYKSFAQQVSRTEKARRSLFYPVVISTGTLAVKPDFVFHNDLEVQLKTGSKEQDAVIHYTLDGTEPTESSPLYTESLRLKKSVTLRAALFFKGKQIGHGSRKNLTAVKPESNLALGKPVSSTATTGAPFSVGRITDGGTANLDFYLGYPAEPRPIEITIDLEEIRQVSKVVVYAYTISNSFEKYSVEVSTDGKQFETVASRLERPEKASSRVEHSFKIRPVRYVRLKSHGNKGYVFDSFSKIVEVQVFE